MKYDHRIVCFIDILGFRAYINGSIDKKQRDVPAKINKINEILLLIRDILDMDSPSNVLSSKKITQFSDSIVISFIVDEPNEVYLTLSEIQHIIVNFIVRGFLIRGGISYGKLIHDDKLIYGPGLITAYDTESKAALFPRVILDKTVIKIAEMYGDIRGDYNELPFESIITKDSDEMYYIDYFSKVASEMDDNDQWIKYLKGLKKIIDNYKDLTFSSPDIKVKIGWIINKYNKLISELKNKDLLKRLKNEGDSDLVKFYKSLKQID